MRERLFRGKRIDNGEWVEGWLVIKKDPVLEITYCFILGYGEGESFSTWYPVDPATVGQYTELNANGKMIFEGDLVKGLFLFGSPVLGVVTFKDGAFGLAWKRGEVDEFSAFTSICNVEYEVVGNVYDNPELMK